MYNENRKKPRELKRSVKQLIYYRAITQRKVPREFLANQLIKEIEEAGEIAPAVETAKRYISRARNSDNPIDKPWSLGACKDYPDDFPISSLPLLIKYKSLFRQEINENNKNKYNSFSIRKAKWMVRLQPILQNLLKYADGLDEYSAVSNAAEGYYHAELMSELMEDTTFDSTYLDDYLCEGDIANIFSLGLGFLRETNTICKGDCNDCEYVSLFKGLLDDPKKGKYCVPKFMQKYIKITDNKVEYPVFEGEEK